MHLLKHLNNISVWWHTLGTTSVVIAVLAAAPKHQSADFVFRTFIDGTGVNGNEGWGTRASRAYVCVIGMLMAQYTLTGERSEYLRMALMEPLNQGYDASAHVRVSYSVWCDADLISMMFR